MCCLAMRLDLEKRLARLTKLQQSNAKLMFHSHAISESELESFITIAEARQQIEAMAIVKR